jgi:hypothetical protein
LAENTEERGGRPLRRLGWVAVAFFTLKGLAWLLAGTGAWKLFRWFEG